jgi:hypothetical protein
MFAHRIVALTGPAAVHWTQVQEPAGRSPPVHSGYTRSRQVAECNGHERSPRGLRNRRLDCQHRRHQAPLQEAGQSSSLPTHGRHGLPEICQRRCLGLPRVPMRRHVG